jgi:hypothetical protein
MSVKIEICHRLYRSILKLRFLLSATCGYISHYCCNFNCALNDRSGHTNCIMYQLAFSAESNWNRGFRGVE